MVDQYGQIASSDEDAEMGEHVGAALADDLRPPIGAVEAGWCFLVKKVLYCERGDRGDGV